MPKTVDEAAHRATVLIVDDEAELRSMLATGLTISGYDVLEAASVEAAQQVLHDHRQIDIVISDVRMPGGADGTDLAIWLYRFRPETILILTSGYFQLAEAEAGPMVYGHRLPKPFRPSQAVQLIEQCLAKRAEERSRSDDFHHGHFR
ncbi:MAG TPA: response regulator [Aliidongia sp.]|uniref:response regulator n=1 Tax=Aliidongia sp. TaxID=1914230 RepID=UPI002DDD80DC|nr:response regulator [Aliidongia sp.]HEV2676437.1 response regulator [Aliidongia sp.]